VAFLRALEAGIIQELEKASETDWAGSTMEVTRDGRVVWELPFEMASVELNDSVFLTPRRWLRITNAAHHRGWAMDARLFELIVLALASAALCSWASTSGQVLASGVFAGLTSAIAVLALALSRVV
jgi:nitrate reductase gamma subunit